MSAPQDLVMRYTLYAAHSHALSVPWLRKQRTVAGERHLQVDLQCNTTVDIEY